MSVQGPFRVGNSQDAYGQVFHAISDQPWLVGSLLSVAGAVLGAGGLTLQKAAHYRLAKISENGERSLPAPYHKLASSPTYCLGVVLMVSHLVVMTLALTYAPETTVAPLGALQVVISFMMAYGLLHERFNKTDVRATCTCIFGLAMAVVSMPRNIPGYMENFPMNEFVEFCEGLHRNRGFMIYLQVWSLLVAICLFCLYMKSLRKIAKPFALPMLVGLLSSGWQFAAKLAGTLAHRGWKQPDVWYFSATHIIMVSTCILFVLSLCATCEGLRHLDLRFFAPTSFSATMAGTLVQGIVFFREWKLMTSIDLCVFTIACLISMAATLWISPEHKRLAVAESSSIGSTEPLLSQIPSSDCSDPLLQHKAVLQIMEEHRMLKPEARCQRPLKVIDLHVPTSNAKHACLLRAVMRFVPLLVCISMVVVIWGSFLLDYLVVTFGLLTIWGMYQSYKYGLHIALFAYVGQRKMAAYSTADFHKLYLAQRKQRLLEGESEIPSGQPDWDDVTHFVVLPNYKEDEEILRLAIRSVAASKMASKQIGLVMGMELREEGSLQKAEALKAEFKCQFKDFIITMHPPGLDGETPGKSSNTRWATKQLFEVEIPRMGLDMSNVIMTVADADSEFHSEYFAALSYAFVNAGGPEGQTPERHLSIWQAPILHYKNYHTQPAIVRLASFFVSQHELANLSDPNAQKIPYSTYSISASLAFAVNGWDPDWISEDWHMGLKCFLATGSRVQIHPIFLAVMNYAPEGDSFLETMHARWEQAKRHALGFSEVVFFQEHFPLVLMSVQGRWRQLIFLWRAAFLYTKMVLIHSIMATMMFLAPLNGALIAYFCQREIAGWLNSWTFLTNCVFQCLGVISLFLMIFTNVLLYERMHLRIDGGNDPNKGFMFRHRWSHFAQVLGISVCILPFFFIFGGAAEWIAAVKTAQTHRFHYVVALKPTLGKPTTVDEASKQERA